MEGMEGVEGVEWEGELSCTQGSLEHISCVVGSPASRAFGSQQVGEYSQGCSSSRVASGSCSFS